MKKLAPLFAFAVVALASTAHADDKVVVLKPAMNTIVLRDHVIYGRAPRPMAVTEVTTLPAQTTVTELKQPFVQRVEQAVHASPF